MTNFLLQLGFMSLKATVIIGVVLILRFIFSGLHIAKKYVILLWIIPYIAMIIPWGVKMSFSFWNLTLEEQTKVEVDGCVLVDAALAGKQIADFIQFCGLSALSGNDKRCSGFIDQYGVHLVNDGIM